METAVQIITSGRHREFVTLSPKGDQANDIILYLDDYTWLGNDSWANGFDWTAGLTWAGNVTAATPTKSYQSPGRTGCRLISLEVQESS